MVSNFELWKLKDRFEQGYGCAVGNEITNYGERFVVVVNRKQGKIAQIIRTSANRYDIIKACAETCSQTYRKSFSEAERVVNKFLQAL